MKAQLNDIKAALLFLLIFQIREQEDEITDEQQLLIEDTFKKLFDMGYVMDDEDITYNNEGYPTNVIAWENPDQNEESILKIYEAVDYRPYYMA